VMMIEIVGLFSVWLGLTIGLALELMLMFNPTLPHCTHSLGEKALIVSDW